MSEDKLAKAHPVHQPGFGLLGGVRIPGQGPKLLLGRHHLRVKHDLSGISELTKPAKPPTGPTYPGTADIIRDPQDVFRGLGLDLATERQLELELRKLTREGSPIEFRKSLVAALRQVAPEDFMLRNELSRRAAEYWKLMTAGFDRRFPDRIVVQKSIEPEVLDALQKATRPHKYIRKYRKGDHWVYVYEDKRASDGERHRYEDEAARERMMELGDELYALQSADAMSKDDTGFNNFDMQQWQMVRGNVRGMKRVLAKYKRQLGVEEHSLMGLTDQEATESSVKAEFHPRWGSLMLPLEGRVGRAKWKDYLAANHYLKGEGLVRFDGQSKVWYVPKDRLDDLTPEIWAEFTKRMAAAGVTVGPLPDRPAAKPKRPDAPDVPDEPTVDDVIERIQARHPIPNTIAVKRDKEGLFHFYSPFSRDFNNVFSNKSGMISGITEFNPDTKARMTFDLALVEEAIDKLKSVMPDWKVVTEGVEEAKVERDKRSAELRKPIPEVADKLAPGYALFPYQNEAVRFLMDNDGKALVGDEMGLGKTLQSLAYVAATGKRVLVVVPKVVRRTWIQEAEKFFPDYFKGSTRELVSSDIKKHGMPDLSDVRIAAVNYESLQKFMPAIKAAGFDTIVVDESHRIKNPKAKITRTLMAMRDMFAHRMLLSGTAVKNKKDELHTQTEFIEPGVFTRSELQYGTIGGIWNKLKRTMYIARQKRTVLPDLPDKITQITEHPVSSMPDFPSDIGEMSAARVSAALAKAPVTADFVKEALATSDSSLLVFTESKEAAERIAAKLGDVAILHHGQMSDNKREAAKEEFQREGTTKRVFVSTRQSLAVGATLTAADKVVFNDIPWTAADLRQAEDRAHRVGQKNNVNVYWMTAQESEWDKAASGILLRKYELNRRLNEGRQLTEEERKWMTTPVLLSEIRDELQGAKVGPRITAGTAPKEAKPQAAPVQVEPIKSAEPRKPADRGVSGWADMTDKEKLAALKQVAADRKWNIGSDGDSYTVLNQYGVDIGRGSLDHIHFQNFGGPPALVIDSDPKPKSAREYAKERKRKRELADRRRNVERYRQSADTVAGLGDLVSAKNYREIADLFAQGKDKEAKAAAEREADRQFKETQKRKEAEKPKGPMQQLDLFGNPVKKSVTDADLDRLRPRLMMRMTSHPLELVWMAEEIPDELQRMAARKPPGFPELDELFKAKYFKREGVPGNYRYYYKRADGTVQMVRQKHINPGSRGPYKTKKDKAGNVVITGGTKPPGTGWSKPDAAGFRRRRTQVEGVYGSWEFWHPTETSRQVGMFGATTDPKLEGKPKPKAPIVVEPDKPAADQLDLFKALLATGLYEEVLEKSGGGPFIGPRGGKWADAAHTIPWDDKANARQSALSNMSLDDIMEHALKMHGQEAVAAAATRAVKGVCEVTDQALQSKAKQLVDHPEIKAAADRATSGLTRKSGPEAFKAAREAIAKDPAVREAAKREMGGFEDALGDAVAGKILEAIPGKKPSKLRAVLRAVVTGGAGSFVFGFLDNFVMYLAGASIDKTLLSIGIGAGFIPGVGNAISDAFGKGAEGSVERLLDKVGLGEDQTAGQLSETTEKRIKFAASIGGIFVGAIVGTIPQLFGVGFGKSLRAPLWIDLLEKGAGHKYLRRIPTGKPRPRYRYIYRDPKTKQLVADEHLVAGSKFKVEHQGQKGHFEVRAHDKGKGVVTVRHDESGRTVHLKSKDLHRMLQRQMSQRTREELTEYAPRGGVGGEPLRLRTQETQTRIPGTGKADFPQPDKPAKAAPQLKRATMGDLGTGGYDSIEGFSQDVRDLEAQAAKMKGDRTFAIIPQSGGFVLASKAKTSGTGVGDSTEVFMRGGDRGKEIQQVKAEYVLMEASDVVASHDPKSFGERKDYPTGVQERRYHAIQEEQGKIDRIARNLEPAIVVNTNPDAINGAPVVTEDGVVLGGNGRTMGMQRAYELYPDSAKKLKAYLAQHAKAFGMSPAQIQGMKQPILVRRMEAGSDTDKLRALGRRMNEALTQGLDPRSAEVAIGKNYVTQDVVDSLTHQMEGDESLGEFLRSPRAKPFVATLTRAGIIDQFNRSEFVDQKTGQLNEDGRMRVERVLAARMIPDATLLGQMSQSLRQNIAKAVPYLLRAESSGWDVRNALTDAVRADVDMRQRGDEYKPNAKGRDRYLRQQEIGGAEGPASKVRNNALAGAMLTIIQDHNGARKLPQGFKQFALEADKQAFDHGSQGSMFARPKMEMDEALAQSFETAKPRSQAESIPHIPQPDTQTQSLFKAMPPQNLARYVMHTINWELERLVSGAIASVDPGSGIDGSQVLSKLRSFIVDQAHRDKDFARGMGVQPLDTKVLSGLLQAHAQARVTDIAKSLAKAMLCDNLRKAQE